MLLTFMVWCLDEWAGGGCGVVGGVVYEEIEASDALRSGYERRHVGMETPVMAYACHVLGVYAVQVLEAGLVFVFVVR